MTYRPIFTQDVGFIGPKILKKEDLSSVYEQSLGIYATLSIQDFSFLDASFTQKIIGKFQSYAEYFQQFQKILIIGNPDDLIATKMLVSLLQSWIWIEDSFPRICFANAADPETFWELMSITAMKQTIILVISRNGEEPEVLLPFMRCLEYAESLLSQKELGEHFFVITQKGKGTLWQIAEALHLTFLPYPDTKTPFCFSFGALLPAMSIGFNAQRFFEGAEITAKQFFGHLLKTPLESASLSTALLKYAGISCHLLYPHGEVFCTWSKWYKHVLNTTWGHAQTSFNTLLGSDVTHRKNNLPMISESSFFSTLLLEIYDPYEGLKPEMWSSLPKLRDLSTTPLSRVIKKQCDEHIKTLSQYAHPFRVLKVHMLNEKTLGALTMSAILENAILSMLLKNGILKK